MRTNGPLGIPPRYRAWYHNHMHKVALQKPSLALKLANVFGVFGYFSLFLEWLWMLALLLYPYAKSVNFMLPKGAAPHTAMPPAPLFSPNTTMSLIIGGIVVLACLVIMIYGFYTMPRVLAKAGSQTTRAFARAIVPAVVHHKKVGKKRERRITYVVIICLKVAAAVLPLIAFAVTPEFPALSKPIVGTVTLFFSSWAIIDFIIQHTIIKLTHTDTNLAW